MHQRSFLLVPIVLTATLGAAAPALGQTCNPPATQNGADVIVGDLHQIINYTGDGTYDAFSMGTYSCNIGDFWLNWFASTNQHPVIGQAVYKMKTHANGVTTFEQLGQSWLKHGFFALSNTLCCTQCQGTDGTHLGVRCSDPYSAARNGDQAPLGPKYQVNATTGFFPYPPANPSWSGTVARRLAVRVSDLEPSSATVRYFGSSIYISPDEPTANRFNNQSYRPLSLTGSGTAWTFALGGPTQRTRAGIYAWPDNEPGVTVKEGFVSPDGNEVGGTRLGLFILAAKVYDLGGGQWHYEYALQNYNSHRSGRAFSLPIPAGVTLSSIGFRDVEYRNGDGEGNISQDGTDWTTTVGGGAITWATQTYAENPNANALRWDTIYNFRYVANTPPALTGGPATITLFRPITNPTDPTEIVIQGMPVPSAPVLNPADLDRDGDVDIQDLSLMLASFGLCSGDPGFNPAADIGGDGCVGLPDLTELLANFGL